MECVFDVLIIGAGPAGLSASVYSARKMISTALITKKVGGQLLDSSCVENYLGLDDESGADITKKFHDHLNRYKKNISIFYDEAVLEISKEDEIFLVKTDTRVFKSKAVIVATGRTYEKLNVQGEEEFTRKGVAYCAICDAPLFLDEDVVVAGGGNAAIDAVLQLTEYANTIYLVDEADKIVADEILVQRALSSKKVIVCNNSKIVKLEGDDFLKKVIIQKDGKTEEISASGLFVEIGSKANSKFIENFVETNEFGEIKIDKKCQTSVEGLFAAGDVSDVYGKQAIISAGEGAKASLAVYEYLKKA